MKPNDIRAFIAIELDKDLRLKIKKIQEILKESKADVKWVNSENIHLTLKFLGRVPTASLDDLCQTIKQVTAEFPSFEFELNACGWFPAEGQPRILWIGVGLGKDLVEKIAATLSSHVSRFCEEKNSEKFLAHITVGRVKSGKNISILLSAISKLDLDFPKKQKVNHITFFQSRLTPSGPEYKKIYKFDLM